MGNELALILAVDHNSGANITIAKPLTLLGHQVITVNEVDAALDWLEDNKQAPDLFIVDVGLKKFEGLEFVQFLKSEKRYEPIPVLIQSMSETMDLYQHSEGILMKPYSAAELIRQVALLLSSK